MKQVLQSYRDGSLGVREVPAPVCGPGEVLVATRASLISVGTERASAELARKSLLMKARDRPDLVRQVQRKLARDGLVATVRTVRARLDVPVPLGYSLAGVVHEVGEGVTDLAPGERVAAAGARVANHAEWNAVPRNLCAPIPSGVDDSSAAFVTLGAIALHGVRLAELGLGDRVGVIGLGLVGQLTVQLLAAQGARVLAIDLDGERVERALASGAERAVRRADDVVAAARALTAGRGLDAVLITAATDSGDPLELAVELARDRARVVAVGAVPLDVPRAPFYAKELELRVSRSYGPGRYDPVYEEGGVDYPLGYVRWTEGRNLEEVLDLMARGALRVEPLITHRFPIERATEAYALVTGATRPAPLGVLLDYAGTAPLERGVRLAPTPAAKPGVVRVGVIGAGQFTAGTLLPALSRMLPVRVDAIASARGLSARHLAERFELPRCATDARALFDDPELDAVVIATRHHQHAEQAAAALEAGKDVFVEKPLAITEESLARVLDAATRSGRRLLVGHNRRFAPLSRELRAAFADLDEPLTLVARVNAGPLDPASWHADPAVGGGRVLGELGHFVDWLRFVAASPPTSVHAVDAATALGEQLVVTLRFATGSVASLVYCAGGDPRFPKERYEVFGGGRVAVLDDFRRLSITRDGRTRTRRSLAQDKGHVAELEAFVDAIRSGAPSPVSLDDTAATARTGLAVLDSLETGRTTRIHLD